MQTNNRADSRTAAVVGQSLKVFNHKRLKILGIIHRSDSAFETALFFCRISTLYVDLLILEYNTLCFIQKLITDHLHRSL